MALEPIRVIALGNPYMGDDSLALAALQLLQNKDLPPHIELIDGGCGGLQLLRLFEDGWRTIILDAADFQAPAGTIKHIENPTQAVIPIREQLTSHQPGLAEILKILETFDALPPLDLVVMQVASCQPNAPLSPAVTARLPAYITLICKLLHHSKHKNILRQIKPY